MYYNNIEYNYVCNIKHYYILYNYVCNIKHYYILYNNVL